MNPANPYASRFDLAYGYPPDYYDGTEEPVLAVNATPSAVSMIPWLIIGAWLLFSGGGSRY